MPRYLVQIIGPGGEVAKEVVVAGQGPDDAAAVAVGEPLIRGAKGIRKMLRAKVYWESHGTPTMARFYADNDRVVQLREP